MEYWIIGLIAGDGHIEKSNRVVISSKLEEFIDLSMESLQKFETKNRRVSKFFDKNANVWKISLKSDKLVKILESTGIPKGRKFDKIDLRLENLNKEQRQELVAGLIDAEGWYENDKGSPRIRFKVKNEKLRNQLSGILDYLGVNHANFYKDECFGFSIQGINRVSKFIDLIPLKHPKWKNLISALRG